MVKNPPSNARDVGLIPGWGTKIPHTAGQLSPHAATTELTRYRAHMPQLESPCAATTKPMHSGACVTQLEKPMHLNEELMHCNEKIPHVTTKIPCAATKTQSSQINKYKIIKKERKRDFPGGAVVGNPPTNAGGTGLSPDLGRSHMLQSN